MVRLFPLSFSPQAHTDRIRNAAGLRSFKVDLPAQRADVYTDTVPYEMVLEKIRKTGKEVVRGERDGVEVAL